MSEQKKKLGLMTVIATAVGLIVATSTLFSIGQGTSAVGTTFMWAMFIACALNILTALSVSELNALMPNLTGGLAQYTLACMGPLVSLVIMVGGYLVGNTMFGSAECAMFGNTLTSVFPQIPIPATVYSIILVVVLIIVNLNGIDMFAKLQDFVAYGLIISLVIMGVLGTIKVGPGTVVNQPAVLSSNFYDVTSLCGLAFFLFIGCEYAIPIASNVRNARRNIPLGMVISLLVICFMQVFIIIGFKNYVPWAQLKASPIPHVLYGTLLLGPIGTYWMALVSVFAVISSVNTIISALAYIASGMGKIGLLPSIFSKTNKNGAPWFGILVFGGGIFGITSTGLSTSSALSFLILSCNTFWMASYVIINLDVLILRHRLPKAPRTFKVPGGPVIPIIGAAGMVWMIYNISNDPAQRMAIYGMCLIVLVILTILSVIWIRMKFKRPLFKSLHVEEVMAMENELYRVYHGSGKELQAESEKG